MKLTVQLICAIVMLISIHSSSTAAMKAGLASVVITPDEYLWMSGYAARTKPAEGKIHDLYAKAVAIEDEHGTKAVIVTTDLIGISAEFSQNVAKRIHDEIGIPRQAIMITSSHTHSGPVIRKNLETMYELDDEMWAKITQYTKDLEDKVVGIIVDAVNNLEPAQINRGNGHATFGANRRIYTENGMAFGVNPIGPVDHDVPFLQINDSDGKQKGLLFGYACHNTTLSGYDYCGDYAGFAQEYLDQVFPGGVNMFFTGCGADINPHPRREVEYAKKHGDELGGAVQNALHDTLKAVDGTIQLAYSDLMVPLTQAPNQDQLKQQLEHSNKYVKLLAQSLIKKLDEGSNLPESYPVPIQVWSIGDWKVIALGGEVVVDYALLFKHLYGEENTWVISYANDVMCYIPSLRVLQEGGYEADDSMIYYGFHGPWQPKIQNLIVNEVDRLIQSLQ